jgi:hypothetical protein
MIRLIALLVALSLPLAAEAACTHATSGGTTTITCTTGTESTLTQSSTTEGLSLDSTFFGKAVYGIAVHAETAGTMTAGGTLQAWLQNPSTGQWNRAPDLDLTVQALARQSWLGLRTVAPRGRLAYLPNGVGLAVTVYLVSSFE